MQESNPLLDDNLRPTRPLQASKGEKIVRTYFFIEGMWNVVSTIVPDESGR